LRTCSNTIIFNKHLIPLHQRPIEGSTRRVLVEGFKKHFFY